MDFHRVLSIQSHVVSGYVGNKSACFPLQVCSSVCNFCRKNLNVLHSDHREKKLYKTNACILKYDVWQ